MGTDDLPARLRRIEGQMRGVARMIESHHCVADAVAGGGEDADRKPNKATAAVQRLRKS